MKKKHAIWIVALCFILILFASSVYFQSKLVSLIGLFETFSVEHPFLAPAVFITIGVLSILLGPFTSVPLVPFAISAWGVLPTLSMLMLGWLGGAVISYFIGFYAGKPFVSFIVGKAKLQDWTDKIKPHTDLPLMLLFRLSMPSETGYVFGLFGYDFGKYMFITALAEFPFAIIVVYAGNAFLNTGWITFAALIFAGTGAILLFYRMFAKKIKKRNEK